MQSLQSNTLLSTTKCSNLCSVSLRINRNLDTALAFKNYRAELRGGLRNKTISKKEGHRYFIKNGQSPGGQTTAEMTPRVSTLMKCVVSTAVVPPEVRSTGEEPPPPPTAETGARCFWTQDTHFATGAEQGTLPESQVFLNCSSSWVSQLLGICKRTKCKYSPLPFFFQSNYVVWPYWALMPKRICTRPQNSEFHMKLMGQVETYREVKDNRLEDHAISFSAEAGAHLDSSGRSECRSCSWAQQSTDVEARWWAAGLRSTMLFVMEEEKTRHENQRKERQKLRSLQI